MIKFKISLAPQCLLRPATSLIRDRPPLSFSQHGSQSFNGFGRLPECDDSAGKKREMAWLRRRLP